MSEIWGNNVAQDSPYYTTHGPDHGHTGGSLIWYQKLMVPFNARITGVHFYCKSDWSGGWSYTANVGFYNSDGIWMKWSEAHSGVGGDAWGWRDKSIAGSPYYVDLASGVQYYFSIRSSAIDDSYGVWWAYNNSVANNLAYNASDPNHFPSFSSFTYTGNFCVYFDYTLLPPSSGVPSINLGNQDYYYPYPTSLPVDGAAMIAITTPDSVYDIEVSAIKSFVGPSLSIPSKYAYLKPVIWRASDGVIVTDGVGPEHTLNAGSPSAWHTMSYVTKPKLTPNTNYYIGYVVGGTFIHIGQLLSGYMGGTDVTNSYSSPQIYNGGINSRPYSIYMVYNYEMPAGPSIKIEGITPGKLEYTSWSQISTVR